MLCDARRRGFAAKPTPPRGTGTCTRQLAARHAGARRVGGLLTTSTKRLPGVMSQNPRATSAEPNREAFEAALVAFKAAFIAWQARGPPVDHIEARAARWRR